MNKIISLSEFQKKVGGRAKVGVGGFDLHRKPMSLVLALANSPRLNGLELFGISLALEADILIGGDKTRKIISSYTGLENFGQCYFFREGVEQGKVEPVEMSTYATILSLQAGAEGVQYIPTRTMVYSDMSKNNELVKIAESPIDGERIAVVKAYIPDVALIHAQEADSDGNVRIDSPPATRVDDYLARASRKTFVSVEKIVDRIENPTISGLYVDYIIQSPGGSAPTSLHPRWDVNSNAMNLYGRGSKERDLEFCKEVIANAIERRGKD
ncbi:MAG: CoA transferase subunit A [Candidatus Heimdallarchaeaceae archaeon]